MGEILYVMGQNRYVMGQIQGVMNQCIPRSLTDALRYDSVRFAMESEMSMIPFTDWAHHAHSLYFESQRMHMICPGCRSTGLLMANTLIHFCV